MWDMLQSSAFLLDGQKVPSVGLLEPLRRLLPCVYCRNSYVDFYKALGQPKRGLAATWVYDVHKLVNRKLMRQRAEAFVAKMPKHQGLVAESHELLSEPKLDVLQKRFLVNREEPICRRGLLTVLLAIVMALETNHENLLALDKFLKAVIGVVILSKQYNADELIDILERLRSIKTTVEMRLFLDYMKYGTANGNSGLIKAGACIDGTCA
jgi:hypothetical protein